MKKLLILTVLCLALTACSTPQQPQTAFAPEQDACLTVYTTMEKTLWEPFLLEFQEKTGIWVRLEQEDCQHLTQTMEEKAGQIDLLLGCGTDTLTEIETFLAPVPGAAEKNARWTPAFYQIPVLIYNPYLIQKNLPAGFLDLLDPRWQGSFAFPDPNSNAVSRSVLTQLVQLRPEEDEKKLLEQFMGNIGGIFKNNREVLAAVADGTCPLGIVPESAALAAVSRGEKLVIVYPGEGELLVPAAMAMPKTCPHPEQAEKLMKFLLDGYTQRHGWKFCNLRPILNEPDYLPEHPVYEDSGQVPALCRRLLPFWNEIQEGTK